MKTPSAIHNGLSVVLLVLVCYVVCYVGGIFFFFFFAHPLNAVKVSTLHYHLFVYIYIQNEHNQIRNDLQFCGG